MDAPTEFELSQWRKEARRRITCTGCYGSGEDRWKQGYCCPVCEGAGKAVAEPHVLRLCDEVERLRLLVEGEE